MPRSFTCPVVTLEPKAIEFKACLRVLEVFSIIGVMEPATWQKILDLCNRLSNVTYENLTKIIRLESTGSATAARNLDDSDQNDIDTWMGGGTCFSMTWLLYQSLRDMGLEPRLVMGHKRKERNIHCALVLPDETAEPSSLISHSTSHISHFSFKEFLFDPGYLIFDPLPIPLPQPFGTGESLFPLVPNSVRLVRPDMDSMELWTGGSLRTDGKLNSPMKLRFEYPVAGVSVEEFKQHWAESFYREMMTYPVLNRLDRERGVQYYYQKGNLVTRDANGSRMERLDESVRVEKLSEIFKLSPELVSKALGILSK
ncbi:hypothetical protein [Fibrobacter succinogenes]|uniref:hypothetical protein n=1 Tax=Fibrobacter succinogenes TaxID=833 RepID=UPI0026EFDFE9|nr:hypothetical protein [Fibrobacter succinogenes]